MATRRRPSQADVRRLALALPDAEEGAHHGTPDFRVGGKIFATLPSKHPGRVVVKADPAELDLRVQHDPATYCDTWGGRWMGVELARITPADLKELLAAARQLVARRRARS